MQEPEIILGARRMRTPTLAHFRSAVAVVVDSSSKASGSSARVNGGGHFNFSG